MTRTAATTRVVTRLRVTTLPAGAPLRRHRSRRRRRRRQRLRWPRPARSASSACDNRVRFRAEPLDCQSHGRRARTRLPVRRNNSLARSAAATDAATTDAAATAADVFASPCQRAPAARYTVAQLCASRPTTVPVVFAPCPVAPTE